LLGNFFLTLAVILWSFYLVYSKKLQETFSPFIITCHFIFLSTIVMFPFFLWELQTQSGWWVHVTWWGIFSVSYLAIVITIFNYMLSQYTIKHGGAVMASMMFYIMPVFSFIINFFLLGEFLTPGFIFGSLLALLGTYLVVRR
ncbi:MAG TPA: DMT family transporter, partial [Patescibacteria group bacterium]|nr:DMT family transporter [Patescibacteria group bacterium]